MVQVHGKIKLDIEISVYDAYHILHEDCLKHDANFYNAGDDDTVAIRNSLYVLTWNNINKVFKKDIALSVPCIYDTALNKYIVDSKDVLAKLIEKFNGESFYSNFCISAETKTPKKRGVYSYFDGSQHGSPDYSYKMIYEGIEAEQVFEALDYLGRNYREYLNSKNEAQVKTLEK